MKYKKKCYDCIYLRQDKSDNFYCKLGYDRIKGGLNQLGGTVIYSVHECLSYQSRIYDFINGELYLKEEFNE